MSDLMRVYLDPDEIGKGGYPYAWHGERQIRTNDLPTGEPPYRYATLMVPSIKDLVREQAGHRCVRCGHPYRKGEHGKGRYTPCDEHCTHLIDLSRERDPDIALEGGWLAAWRILTVHHLNGVKHDCRWWNLAALCQRCHLTIQGRVVMNRVYPLEHSEWFKPYAAGWYASAYLGEELTRDETMVRLDELLALERVS